MKISKRLLIAGLVLVLSPWLIQGEGRTQANGEVPRIQAPPNTLDLLRKSLKDGTPEEKEAALNVIRDLKPIALIPDIIEAIQDPTPLPRHGDTGWGFVAHQAATVIGEIARSIDHVDVKTRGNGYDEYSFYNDQYKGGQNLKTEGRLSKVSANWAKWWESHRYK